MKRVYTHESLAQIAHLKNLLEQAGIACMVKNDQLLGGLGEIPFLDCSPELWVLKAEDVDRARRLLAEVLAEPSDAPQWRCNGCGELNEGQFAVCWQCGQSDASER